MITGLIIFTNISSLFEESLLSEARLSPRFRPEKMPKQEDQFSNEGRSLLSYHSMTVEEQLRIKFLSEKSTKPAEEYTLGDRITKTTGIADIARKVANTNDVVKKFQFNIQGVIQN